MVGSALGQWGNVPVIASQRSLSRWHKRTSKRRVDYRV